MKNSLERSNEIVQVRRSLRQFGVNGSKKSGYKSRRRSKRKSLKNRHNKNKQINKYNKTSQPRWLISKNKITMKKNHKGLNL